MTGPTAAQEADALDVGVKAVIYGLPLVMMDLTMRRAVNVPRPVGVAAPVNQFESMRAFPTAAFKDVVRANVDTLYSSAFLDLSKEPFVLSVPDTHGRYYLLPMFDTWTNVFADAAAAESGRLAGHLYPARGALWRARRELAARAAARLQRHVAHVLANGHGAVDHRWQLGAAANHPGAVVHRSTFR